MFDGEAFGREIVAATKAHVDKALKPLLGRIDAIEKKMAEMAADDIADLQAVKSDIEGIRKAVAEMPVPKDGADGKDGEPGKSITVADVAPLITSEVAKAVSALPPAKDGVDGKDGRDGVDGKQGERGFGLDDFDTEISEDGKSFLLKFTRGDQEEVHEIPLPAGRDGLNGKDGRDGADGKDGVGFADAMIDKEGRLVLTRTDGQAKELPVVVGRDGKDGRDGQDGKSIDIAEVAELVSRETAVAVEKAVSALPIPEKGEKGDPGEPGKDGSPGRDGKDGLDAVTFFKDANRHVIATMSDGSTRDLGLFDGKDGEPGKDGSDGKDGRDVDDDAILRMVRTTPEYAPDDVAASIVLGMKTLAGYSRKADSEGISRQAPIAVHMPPVTVAMPEIPAPVVNVAPAEVSVVLPKKGKEVTRVTEWDTAGRIKAFEKFEE